MGLMHLWLIPQGSCAADGAFLNYPLKDMLRLLALESHRYGAVVVGEDLGTVPPDFRARLHDGVSGAWMFSGFSAMRRISFRLRQGERMRWR